MIGRHRYGLLLLWLTTSSFAIEVGTSIASVSHEGTSETVGSITLTLFDDELAGASPTTPIYIRIGLNQSRGWSRTLVDPRAGSSIDDPINLALYPAGDAAVNPMIPPEAVQLVRMVDGEAFAWVKITSPSTGWLMVNNTPAPPSGTNGVAFTIGIRGNTSVRVGAHTPSEGNEYADTHLLADTRLKANYLGTPNFNNGDLDTVSLIAFDHETTGVETGNPVAGNNTGIGFSNDFAVARAVNYFPCFEYHFSPGEFDSPAYAVPLTRLDLIQRRTYRTYIPPLYLTNSSDFDWEPGSMFFLTHDAYQPAYEVYDQAPPGHYDPQQPTTHLLAEEATLTFGGEASPGMTWTVEGVYFQDRFMGYKLTLTAGKMPPYTFLELSGLRVSTVLDRNAVDAQPLRLSAWGYYKAQGVNPTPQVEEIGPLSTLTATFGLGTDPHQAVLPYVPWDRPDLDFTAHLTNPYPWPVRYTALIYHPYGLLEEVLGDRILPPYGAHTIDFNQWPEDKARLGWMAVYSDYPLAAAGKLTGTNGESLDIYPRSSGLAPKLFGPHITAGTEWETRAYMVSADPDVDPTFTYRFPGMAQEQRVDGFIIPSGTGTLGEEDFFSAPSRPTWFEVNAGANTGAGLVLYRTQGDGGAMTASVPMIDAPATIWRYEHVGNRGNGWWNGVVLTNPQTEPASVSIRGYSSDGTLLSTLNLEVAGDTRTVGTLDSFAQPDPRTARLEVQADHPIVSFLLLGRVEGDRMTTIPGNLTPRTDLVVPYVPDLLEAWVGLALINDHTSANEVRLIPYLADGQAGPEAVITLPPGDKGLYALSDMVDAAQPWTHMILRADKPVTAYALTGSNDNRRLATLPMEAAPAESTP